MAGPNGSQVKRGGPPPQWPTESDEQARALEIERWQQRQAQQRAYSQPHPSPPPGPGYAQPPFEPAYPSQGYGHAPGTGQHEPADRAAYGHPAYPDAADAHRARDPFAQPFDRFAPPAQGRDPLGQHYDPQHAAVGYDHQHAPPAPEARPGFDPYRQPQPYDARHHPSLQPAQQPPQAFGNESRPLDARGDPQSWDLSHYQPGQIPHGYAPGPYQEPQHAQPAQPGWPPQHAGMDDPHWQQTPHGHAQWPHPEDPHGHGLQPFAANGPGHYGQHPQDLGFGHPQGAHDPALDSDEFDAPEEPRRGPSTFLVISMLLGAIVVGGGLAVAYKHFSSGGGLASIAEVKKPSSPEKVRPKDPGGKTMEHSDKKFLNRLASDAPADAQRQSDIDGAAKKVSTIPIVVNRDGSLTSQSSQAQSTGESSGVPGLVLDGLGPPPVPASAPQLRGDGGAVATPASRLPPPPPPPAAVKAVQAAPAAPKVADLPLPKVVPPPTATAAVEKPTAPLKKQKAAVRDDLPAQQAAGASVSEDAPSGLGSAVATPARRPVAATSSSGYVAVLASKKSRQDALNSFADLHSQFPDVLAGMTPDVREANLGDKGMWYRLIVGPPGSREAARSVCVKLKEKGMNDCWPVAY